MDYNVIFWRDEKQNHAPSLSWPVSLTARQTYHKMCDQRKNAIAWASRSVWVHHNRLQFLPCYKYVDEYK